MNRNLERTGHMYPARIGIPRQPLRDNVAANASISVSEGVEEAQRENTLPSCE